MITDITPLNTRDTRKRLVSNTIYHGIFSITCKVNKKKYIVIAGDCDKRMREHLIQLRKGKHKCQNLQEDFKAFGEGKFTFKRLRRYTKAEMAQFTPAKLYAYLAEERNKYITAYATLEPSGYNTPSGRRR